MYAICEFGYVLCKVSGDIYISYLRSALFSVIARSGSFLPTFRDNLSVPSSGVKNKKQASFLSTSQRKPEITHISYLTNMPYILFSAAVVSSLI